MLEQLEREAQQRALILRLKVGRPLGLFSVHVAVGSRSDDAARLVFQGELKAWAYPARHGLQLDTMRVVPGAPPGTGDLIWAATMAWALEATPCRSARLLAIHDDDRQHSRLVRYFERRGFQTLRRVDAALWDLPLRLVWGGSGALMRSEVEAVLERSLKGWRQSAA